MPGSPSSSTRNNNKQEQQGSSIWEKFLFVLMTAFLIVPISVALGGLEGLFLIAMACKTFFFAQQFGFVYLGLSEGSVLSAGIVDVLAGIWGIAFAFYYSGTVTPAIKNLVSNINNGLYGLLDNKPSSKKAKTKQKSKPRINMTWLRKLEIAGLVVPFTTAFTGLLGLSAFQGVITALNTVNSYTPLGSGLYETLLRLGMASAGGFSVAMAAFSIPALIISIQEIYRNHDQQTILGTGFRYIVVDSAQSFKVFVRRLRYGQEASPTLENLQQTSFAEFVGMMGQYYQASRSGNTQEAVSIRKKVKEIFFSFHKPIAAFASLGFALFINYAVDELLQGYFAISDIAIIAPVSIIGTTAMTFINSLTSGYAIDKVFSKRYEEIDRPVEQKPVRFPRLQKFGSALGYFVATFQGVGTFMGLEKMIGYSTELIVCVAIPIGACLFVARMSDFCTFTKPRGDDTFGGDPMRYYRQDADDDDQDDIEFMGYRVWRGLLTQPATAPISDIESPEERRTKLTALKAEIDSLPIPPADADFIEQQNTLKNLNRAEILTKYGIHKSPSQDLLDEEALNDLSFGSSSSS